MQFFFGNVGPLNVDKPMEATILLHSFTFSCGWMIFPVMMDIMGKIARGRKRDEGLQLYTCKSPALLAQFSFFHPTFTWQVPALSFARLAEHHMFGDLSLFASFPILLNRSCCRFTPRARKSLWWACSARRLRRGCWSCGQRTVLRWQALRRQAGDQGTCLAW